MFYMVYVINYSFTVGRKIIFRGCIAKVCDVRKSFEFSLYLYNTQDQNTISILVYAY